MLTAAAVIECFRKKKKSRILPLFLPDFTIKHMVKTGLFWNAFTSFAFALKNVPNSPVPTLASPFNACLKLRQRFLCTTSSSGGLRRVILVGSHAKRSYTQILVKLMVKSGFLGDLECSKTGRFYH